jgi:hypothetical protein
MINKWEFSSNEHQFTVHFEKNDIEYSSFEVQNIWQGVNI